INALLPVAQMGGDLVKGRLIMTNGVPGPVAGASVVVELTIAAVTQLVFTIMGITLLLETGHRQIIIAAVIGLMVMSVLIMGFCLAQRYGIFGGMVKVMVRFGGSRDWSSLVGGSEALDQAIWYLYRRRIQLLQSSLWRLAGWVLGAGEVWLALHFLGAKVGFANALMLESLGQAVRGAAFLVPGALGIQEGGFLVLGASLGLSPDVSLALSLTKRVRELLLGLPGLVAWQIAEGKNLFRRR
ncbi:MAG: flippase-like domain-containing protein, partial [Deltaproteobacteria bacterium]|nr:flippase-like domain-containing protein [Deltaproteobacteria bacterium]